MHGYQANLELERRCIRDWADISRPQVYYSLEKLAAAGLVRARRRGPPAAGPERHVFSTTTKGRNALADALERNEWTTQRDRPAFLTWLALSWLARPGVVEQQLRRRKEFLEAEIARERATLRAVLRETGHRYHEAVWMIRLVIAQFEQELQWLEEVAAELPKRARARHPQIAAPDLD